MLRLQELALRKIHVGIDFLSKLIDNNSEDTDTLKKDVNERMLFGLGNILRMSLMDAAFIKARSCLENGEKNTKVRKYTQVDCVVISVTLVSYYLCTSLHISSYFSPIQDSMIKHDCFVKQISRGNNLRHACNN